MLIGQVAGLQEDLDEGARECEIPNESESEEEPDKDEHEGSKTASKARSA